MCACVCACVCVRVFVIVCVCVCVGNLEVPQPLRKIVTLTSLPAPSLSHWIVRPSPARCTGASPCWAVTFFFKLSQKRTQWPIVLVNLHITALLPSHKHNRKGDYDFPCFNSSFNSFLSSNSLFRFPPVEGFVTSSPSTRSNNCWEVWFFLTNAILWRLLSYVLT